MVFEGKHHMLWAYEAYEEKAKFTGRMWRWGTWGNHRLRTPSTAHGLLPPPADSFHRRGRSPSLKEGGLGVSPVKAYGLAVDCI